MGKQDILIAMDGSQHSLEALNTALEIAVQLKEKVYILNVQPVYETYNTKRFIGKEGIQEYTTQQAEQVFDSARTLISENNQVEFITRTGVPEKEICEEAKERQVRLIVMGSRGLGSIKSALLGSVSLGVIRNAPCPVTIVPFS